jgi:hypothetical protein
MKIRIYKTIILPMVLYRCVNLVSGIKGRKRLRVFEYKVLGRIFRPMGDEVTGGWRELHNEELHNLYSSPSIIRIVESRIMMGRVSSTNDGKRSPCTTLVGKPEENRTLGRPRT